MQTRHQTIKELGNPLCLPTLTLWRQEIWQLFALLVSCPAISVSAFATDVKFATATRNGTVSTVTGIRNTVSGIEMKTKPPCQCQCQSQSQARNWQNWEWTGQKEWIGNWQMVKRDFSKDLGHHWYVINSQKDGWQPLDQNFCCVAAFGIHFVTPDAFCLTQNNNNKAMKSKNVLLPHRPCPTK